MKKQYWIGLIAMVAIAFGVGQAVAQDDAKKEAGDAANWRAKTKQHADMLESVGEYDVVIEMIMGPDAPPQKAPGTAKRESIMNGLYVQETFSMAMPNGKFEGHSVMGYDTVRKEYVSTWIDNQNPVLSISRGTMTDGGLVMTSEDPDMMTGKLGKTKQVLKAEDGTKFVISMYKVTDKGEQMTMRLTYTRKK